jgi:hypothetical protein
MLDVQTVSVHVSSLLQSEVFLVHVWHGGRSVPSLPVGILESRMGRPISELPSSSFIEVSSISVFRIFLFDKRGEVMLQGIGLAFFITRSTGRHFTR